MSATRASFATAAVSLLLAAWFGGGLAGCSNATGPGPGRPAPVRLLMKPSQFQDDRTYSVGRVSLRAFDPEETEIAAQVVPIDRETGVIDVAFSVPAGPGLRILVEPLGGGILPDGERTESGVALQGLSDSFDLEVGGEAEVEIVLDPFIPDDLAVGGLPGGGNRLLLSWRAMPPATSHTVRVLERSRDAETGPVTARDVRVEEGSSAFLDALARTGFVSVGYQVRSENRFSSGAFSDTLFFAFDGGGGPGGDGIPPELSVALIQVTFSVAVHAPLTEGLLTEAVEAAYLARDLSGSDGPVLTGSLTIGEQGYVYSPAPTDRLVLDLGSDLPAEFDFAAFSGPDLGSAEAFLENHDLLDVALTYPGIAEARFVSRLATTTGRDAIFVEWIVDVDGSMLGAGEFATVDLRLDSSRTDDPSRMVVETSVRLTGSSSGSWGSATLDERLDSAATDLGEGSLDDRFSWTSSSAVLIDGERFAFDAFLVEGAWRDGVIADAGLWKAEGRLLRGATPVGTVRFFEEVEAGLTSPPQVVVEIPGAGTLFLILPLD